MLDSISFVSRLKKILAHNELSAAALADLIAVQRSSISHLLSGRNKPSLEFIMKIDEAFSEVDIQWLLYGKGTFPKTENTNFRPKEVIKKESENMESRKKLERIVMFYTDGTFKTYTEFK
ncbi:helix-turn-helix protein [Maribacter spongiicola]|uniref:Helix-turn-helix protein n=1 Tax=Maribacter spongiicola TaxID=1206753 RepID=A0A4R7K3P0_9FLAO|nr:helix-turn-helix transcriptional regulator [Maribacter spongiicola]TDT45116.1 helix-turn-helix protein [Maribacter spongiicola]